jgi:hypothetical protein
VKAREIIAAWPRGRSTTTAWDNREVLMMFRVWRWSDEDRKKLEAEIEDDRRYHERQERMMHEWHTRTVRYREWYFNDTHRPCLPQSYKI